MVIPKDCELGLSPPNSIRPSVHYAFVTFDVSDGPVTGYHYGTLVGQTMSRSFPSCDIGRGGPTFHHVLRPPDIESSIDQL